MLNEFGVSILPIVLKNGEHQKNVVRKILQVDPQVSLLDLRFIMNEEHQKLILPSYQSLVFKNFESQLSWENQTSKCSLLFSQAYKNVRKIIKLVKLLSSLQDAANNEETEILSIVADFAMKASDFDACLTIADILMTSQPASSAACKVCAQLVANEKFENAEAKARLSSFYITYCSDGMIGNFFESFLN